MDDTNIQDLTKPIIGTKVNVARTNGRIEQWTIKRISDDNFVLSKSKRVKSINIFDIVRDNDLWTDTRFNNILKHYGYTKHYTIKSKNDTINILGLVKYTGSNKECIGYADGFAWISDTQFKYTVSSHGIKNEAVIEKLLSFDDFRETFNNWIMDCNGKATNPFAERLKKFELLE